jgi:hypothetical protein
MFERIVGMSFNIVAAWPLAIVCASDRRLTGLLSGDIKTNRSTKMTIFGCADAHGVVVYNGIGKDDSGRTPSDWLLELEETRHIFDGRLPDVISEIGADLEARLRTLRSSYGANTARHTFVIAAWHQGVSLVHGISNYERVDENIELAKGSEKIMFSELPPTREAEVRIVTTGMHSRLADRRAIADAIRQSELRKVRILCIKSVRNLAFGRGKGKGTVGATAQWVLLGADRDEVWYGMDVVGGHTAQESPNLINIAAEIPIAGTQRARIGGPGI